MLPIRRAPLSHAILLLAASALINPAPAERPFQRQWRLHYEEQAKTPPATVEDTAEAPALCSESYIFGDPALSPFPHTAFIIPAPPELAEPRVSPYAAYTRGTFGLEMGVPAAALKGFEEAIAADPTNPWLKLRLAQAAMMINDLSRAQVALEEILAADPTNHRALLQLGEMAMIRQRYGDARTWFEKVIEVKPRNIRALEILAQLSYEVHHDLEATKDYAQRILFIDDKNPQAMLWRAEACAFTGEAERAAEYYARLIRSRPNLVDRVAEVGRRLTAVGRPNDARVLYEGVIRANPTHAELRRSWEESIRQAEGEHGVLAAWRRLAEDSNNDLRVYDQFAEYLRRTNAWDELALVRQQILQREPGHLGSLMDLAWNGLRTNDLEGAESYLNRAMTLHAMDPDVFRQAGQAYLARGDRGRARELLQRSLTLNPRDLLSIDALAGIEEDAGDRAAAERLLRSGLEVAPANSYLLGRLGHFYLRSGERQKARELFQQVLATNPSDVETWLALAELYYQDSDWNGLRILEQTTTQRLANNSRFHAAFGEMALSWGDYHRARTILELALRLAPGDLRTRSLLSRTFLHLELDDRAVDVLKEADSHLGTPALQASRDMLLAATYADLLRHREAESIYRSIYLLDPANFDARRGYLISLLKQGRQDEVERELDGVAREFNKTHEREVQLLRASILRERGEYPRAQALLRELANRFPMEHDITLQLGVVASDAGDLEEAERSYRRLLDIGAAGQNPWFETASNNLGYMFATKGIRLDEAEQLALAALEVNPRAGYILDTVGVVYLRKGDYDKARLYLERAARFSLRDVEIFTNLGELYEKIGEHDLAQQMYDKALATDPTSRLARERRDALADQKKNGTQTRQ